MRQLVLLSVFLVSCGSDFLDASSIHIVPDSTPTVNKDRPSVDQDEALIEITDQFYADAERYGKSTDRSLDSISFVNGFKNQKERTVGLCSTFNYDNGALARKTITILASYWKDATPLCKQSLMYHELGHCALDLDHTADTAKSIMRPSVFCDDYAETHWKELVKELFYAS